MRILFSLLILSSSMFLNAQMLLKTTSGQDYKLNNFEIQKDQVKLISTDNSEMLLSKKEVVYIKKSENEIITFLSGNRKVRLKEENIDPNDPVSLGKIDAYRLYKTGITPDNTDSNYLESYNKQVKKIKRSSVTPVIFGSLALVIGVSSYLATKKEADSLP